MFRALQAHREEQQLVRHEEAAATRARRDFVLEISALLPCLTELQELIGGVFSYQKASVLRAHLALFSGYFRFGNELSERVIVSSGDIEGRAIDRGMINVVIRPAVGQLAFVTSKSIVTSIQVQIAHKQKTDETKEALFHAKQITTAVKDAELVFNSFNEMYGEIPPSIVIVKSQEIKMHLDKALSEARNLLDLAISQALAAELEAAANAVRRRGCVAMIGHVERRIEMMQAVTNQAVALAQKIAVAEETKDEVKISTAKAVAEAACSAADQLILLVKNRDIVVLAAAELSVWAAQPTALSAMQSKAIKQAIKLLESTRAKFTPAPAQHAAANETEQSVASSAATQTPAEQSRFRMGSF